jgi:hypothetical protein
MFTRNHRKTIALLLAILILGTLPAYAALQLPEQVVRPGQRGDSVTLIQTALRQLGYPLSVDGAYGGETRRTLEAFQRAHENLTVDGIYGPKTREAMLAALPAPPEQEEPDAPGIDPNVAVEPNVNQNLDLDLALSYDGANDRTGIVDQTFVDYNRDRMRVTETSPYRILKEWNTALPDSIEKDLAYNRYAMAYDYLLITSQSANVRALPSPEAEVIKTFRYFDKVNLLQTIEDDTPEDFAPDEWYRVIWHENGNIRAGFIYAQYAEPRSFRFNVMVEKLMALEKSVSENRVAYISNYKNWNGRPPLWQGQTKDAFGRDRDQSAPGYTDEAKSDFRYFSDGMVVFVQEETDSYYLVTNQDFEGSYYIPKRYVRFQNAPESLKKAIIIDDLYQNEGIFEKGPDGWKLISLSYASTGTQGEYRFETPKGSFMAIEKKPYFLYLEDGTSRIAGFAPHSIRFSGGGYIHGVPVDYKTGQTHLNTNMRDPKNHQEYLFTIGTTPRSHKCVRNFTSHAEFLYNWATIGETLFIVFK